MSRPVALHEPTLRFAYPLSATELRLCLCLTPEGVRGVQVRFRNKNRPADPWHTQPLERVGFDGMLATYEATLRTPEKTRYLTYAFAVQTDGGVWYLTADGLMQVQPQQGFFEYLYTHESQLPSPPAWARDAVIYQIFPDRFARDAAVPAGRPLRAWDAPPDADGFWGGNLRGILNKVPYLQALGVDAVYLNPVFRSISNHRYDTADYLSVDPLLGDQRDLVCLAEALHASGLRLILDGVFNHCGVDFAPFGDVERRGPASPYWGWFSVGEYPLRYDPPSYEAIGYYRAMPKLRQFSPEVQHYFLAVAEKWTRLLKLDGWRLDVADEIDPAFLARLQRWLLRLNPGMLLLGEAWQENAPLTRAGRLHGIINYPLHRAMVAFFAQDSLTPEAFAARACRSLAAYPAYARPYNACMLDCHDTPRFWSLCGQSPRRLRCALAFLVLWPGMNILYYGDEAGLEGGPDPDCRRAMPWGTENPETEALYREYIRLRRALRGGRVTLEEACLPVVALRSEREDGSAAWALINMGEERSVPLPRGQEAYTLGFAAEDVRVQPLDGALRVTLGRQACAVLIPH